MKPWARRSIFSLNSFVAAMLALFLALRMGLENPFWSVMTVYIVSQPLAGSVRSKALYRLIGTLVGAVAALVLVPALYNSPELLSMALALWVGTCLGVSLLDRTPRSYVLMLSGYTASLIAFPIVGQPDNFFDIAVARVEEIALGIGCATVLHSIVLPQGINTTLAPRIDRFMLDARQWMLDALSGEASSRTQDAHRLASDISELHILATHLPFDTSHYRDRAYEVGQLAERMAVLLPLAAAVGDRIEALRQANSALPQASFALMEAVRGWVDKGSDTDCDAAPALALRARALADMPEDPDFARLALLSLHARLADLVETYRDCLVLARHIETGLPLPASFAHLLSATRHHALHRDYGMALWSAASASLAIMAVCAFWIATGWPDGGTAAMMTAIFMCFFAGMDDPAKAIDKFALSWGISIPLTAAYIFAVMPMLNGFVPLVLALAPVMLVLGYVIAIPRLPALPLAMGFAGSLGIHQTFEPDFAAFANSSIATLVGVLAASSATRLIRSVGSDYSARRIFRLSQLDLERSLITRKLPTPAAWTSRMVDRVGLLGARLAARNDPDDLLLQTFSAMRLGLNILALRRVDEDSPLLDKGGPLHTLLVRYFRNDPDPSLLPHIDAAIARTARSGNTGRRQDALLALLGLRRALFPQSLALGPQG